ncbi:MAG: hypothetical protein M1817_002457 [Caeruleum heppii]|nr:MAG: hypothetical protein M1817_002457 [Caeruleum heppii]
MLALNMGGKDLGCTAEDYVTAIARREITCIQELNRRPRPEGLFGGPGSYEPSTASKLSVLHDYLKVAKQILPRDASISSPHLWHGDLNHDNIFVDPEKPSEIVGLIDWQSVHIEPLFLEVNQPAFLDFDGPRSSGSGLPCLPENFNDLTEVEKNHAKSLLSKQSLFKLYEIESARKNKEVFRALRYQDTLGCQIISLIGHMLNDGEPIVKGQLMQLEREWSKVVGQDGPQCPLRFSVEEEAAQEQDEEKWGKGIVLVDQVLTSLGGAQRGWDGWVAHEDYDLMKEKLQTVRNQFLDYMSNDARDRARWSAVWPFGGS